MQVINAAATIFSLVFVFSHTLWLYKNPCVILEWHLNRVFLPSGGWSLYFTIKPSDFITSENDVKVNFPD